MIAKAFQCHVLKSLRDKKRLRDHAMAGASAPLAWFHREPAGRAKALN
jgi:hypothetical protein